MTTSEQQAVPVAQIDWRLIAKAADEHGVRYRTNTALLAFLDEIEPARKADRFDLSIPCKSGEGAGERLAGRREVNTILSSLMQQLQPECPDMVERIRLGNEACAAILALRTDATQTREAELRERIARAVYQDAPDSNPRDKHRSVAWDYASEHSRARAYRIADAALNARGGA